MDALIVDTNGNGRRDAYVEPDQPVDPTKDKRINSPFYAASPAPDGSVWGSALGFPGAIMRLVPGSNPPETALTEIYELPASSDPKADVLGFSPRGMDVDRNGIAWVALAERTHGELRSPQVQGAAQRPEGDGAALPRRMDVLSRSRCRR